MEAALNAAFQIGDNRLQQQSRGYVVRDSFTHGSSKQRMRWFQEYSHEPRWENGVAPRCWGGVRTKGKDSLDGPMFDINAEVQAALDEVRPVVALESTLIAHGLPWPTNLETARQAEQAVRAAGAIPATVAVLQGRIRIGLNDSELGELARHRDRVRKAGRRDLSAAVAQRQTAATTVSATLYLAGCAGIRLLATGGIGGVHRQPAHDVSADLMELTRQPVAVVCAGAKSILDIPRTLEMLETLGVPVVGYRTDKFPAFYVESSGQPVSARVETPAEAVALLKTHWRLDGGGVILAQPVAPQFALAPAELDAALQQAEALAQAQGIVGPALTPFLLAQLAEQTGGKTLRANQALVVANAQLAAAVAVALAE